MSSEIYEQNCYAHDLEWSIIWHQLHVSSPMFHILEEVSAELRVSI